MEKEILCSGSSVSGESSSSRALLCLTALRTFVLQYTFAMCSYREKKSEPTEMLQLDQFTVDYIEPLTEFEEGRFFFNAVKEGDSVIFACDDENECHLWVMALYRATGQAHKPTPLVQTTKNTTISRLQGDADRARKHGMDEVRVGSRSSAITQGRISCVCAATYKVTKTAFHLFPSSTSPPTRANSTITSCSSFCSQTP